MLLDPARVSSWYHIPTVTSNSKVMELLNVDNYVESILIGEVPYRGALLFTIQCP